MKPRSLFLSFATGVAISFAVTQSAYSIPLWWDDSNGTNQWSDLNNWSDAVAGTGTGAAVPGASDVANFSATGVAGPQVILLNGPQSALGLNASTAGVTTLEGDVSAQTLTLGASGIVAGASVSQLNIGPATGNAVNVLLSANQSWTYGGPGDVGGNGIFVRGTVSNTGGAHLLTLGGSSTASTAISVISGVVSDGDGVMSIAMSPSNTNSRWNLAGNNNYTGTTTITAGGLGITHVNALGAIGAGSGTSVSSGASLFIRANIGTIAAESLTINGAGIASLGALRNVSGTNTWTGAITANTGSGNTAIGSDTGQILTLGSTADITTTGSNSLVFTANGTSGNSVINVDGAISGTAGVAKGGSVANSFVNFGGDAKTYNGATAVNIGTLSINTALTNTSSVTVGSANAATLRGDGGSINTSALTTINTTGTLAPGAATNTIGTLSMGALTFNSGANLAIDINSGTLTKDLLNISNLTITSGAILAINDLGSSSIAIGSALLFIQNSDTWNPADGFFTVGGQVIQDESTTFQVGVNTFQINYDYSGIEGNGVALIVVPEPSGLALAGCAGALTLLRRRRSRK